MGAWVLVNVGWYYWARGMASELVQCNLNYAFYELQLDVVYAAARLYDGASVRLMELNGFVRQPDRKSRDWDVFYSVCPRENYLAKHQN